MRACRFDYQISSLRWKAVWASGMQLVGGSARFQDDGNDDRNDDGNIVILTSGGQVA